MTNVFAGPGKGSLRKRLFEIGVRALEKEGWKVERAEDTRKSSMRRITKGKESKLVSIRTTQDTWIAFPRDKADKKWVTLSDVDAVVAVSVDEPDAPRVGRVHIIDGDDLRNRFDRTYRARIKAGHRIPLGRGVWLSLYDDEANDPPNRIGAGVGKAYPAIASEPLADPDDSRPEREFATQDTDAPLTIAEAKRRLALTFGVSPECVKISIEA